MTGIPEAWEAKTSPVGLRSPVSGTARAVLVSAWLFYTIVLGLLYVRLPPSPDQSIFDFIGWLRLQGENYYTGAADQNWPGAMVLHTVSTGLFGNNLWSFRMFDYLWLMGTCALLFAFCLRHLGRPTALAVVPIYQAMYVSATGWFSGQRDIVAAPFLLIAGMCLLRRLEGGRRPTCVALGVAVAAAVLIRPTLLAAAGFSLLVDLLHIRRTWKGIGSWLIDCVVVFGSILIFLAGFGWIVLGPEGIREWYSVAVRFNLEVDAWDSGTRSLVNTPIVMLSFIGRCWHWYVVLATIALLTQWGPRTRRPFLVLLSILGVGIVSVLAQGQETQYHLGPLLPVLAVLVALCWTEAIGRLCRMEGRVLGIVVAAAIVLLVPAGLAKKMHGTLSPQIGSYFGTVSREEILDRATGSNGADLSVGDMLRLAEHVRATVAPGEPVLFWGPSTLVNYLAGRPSPTRFVSFALAVTPTPTFRCYREWAAELERGLAEKPPAAILLVRDPSRPREYRFLGEGTEPRGFGPIVKRVVEDRYRLERSLGTVDIFRCR